MDIYSAVPSAYIHIPFCKSKCYYCDFNSYIGMESLMEDYFYAIIKEIKMSTSNKKMKLQSVFFGGGTPTYYPSEYIRKILEAIEEKYGMETNCEITIECNPGTLKIEKLQDYKRGGINRVSVGLQSSFNRILSSIGRTHTVQDFEDTIELLQNFGFSNINVDLIEGLPGQTLEDLNQTLEFVLKKEIQHISLYSLSIEEGTIFGKNKNEILKLIPDDETERKMYWDAHHSLLRKGFHHYEISNYAKPGYECKHNMMCWSGENYLGFGAGAHSYANNVRFSNLTDPKAYIEEITQADLTKTLPKRDQYEIIDIRESKKEYFLLGFRLLDGINEREFLKKFKSDFEQFQSILNDLVDKELIYFENNSYKLTSKGIDFANLVFEKFV